jgi:hypothetical protein
MRTSKCSAKNGLPAGNPSHEVRHRSLRSLGVPLARITRALEGDGFTLKDAVTAHL